MRTRRIESPYGCRWCGKEKPHGWVYSASQGYHQWAAPTEAQIKARMLARRKDTP